MPRPILVPLDGSPFSEHAIPVALGIAKRNMLRLELLLVHEPYMAPPAAAREAVYVNPIMDGEWRSRQGAYIRDLVARYSRGAGVAVNGVVMDGSVTGSIAEHAASIEAKLVVLATHGGAPAGRLWLASVPRAVTREAPAPVLLVKPAATDAPRMDGFRSVVIALDGSEISETAIQHALLVAGPGAEYTLLRVVTPVEEWELGAGSWAAEDDLALSEARAYLALHAKRLRARGYRVETTALRGARSADAILRFAKNRSADLIAVTTHSRSAASRFFRRSVADRIARAPGITALVARRLRRANSTATPLPRSKKGKAVVGR